MSRAVRRRFVLWLVTMGLLLAVFAALVLPRLRIETDILALLPEAAADAAGNAAIDHFSQSLSARMVLLVGAEGLPAARAAAQAYARVLRDSGAFASVALEQQAFGPEALRLYDEHRAYLLSRRQLQVLETDGAERLRNEALRAAFTPAGWMRLVSYGTDPLGLANDYFMQQLPAMGAAQLDGRWLTVADGRRNYIVINVVLAGSPFATAVQEAAGGALQRAAAEAGRAAAPAVVDVVSSGSMPHAAAARERATAEMSLFGTIETVLVAALLIAVFGAVRPLALGALTTALAFVAGLCAVHFAFGTVHVLTLVFGSSLIGGVIDYSIHFFADRFRVGEGWTTEDALAHVGGAIVLGLVTTLLAYVVLLVVPFPGLRQIALFCVAGLLTGCFTVLMAYPVLYRPSRRAVSWGPAIGSWLARVFLGWRWSRWRVALCLLLVVGAVLGIVRIRLQDDVRALQSSPPALVRAEQRVTGLLQTGIESRFVLVQAANEQELLARESRLTRGLDGLKAAGQLASYTAISSAVPPLAEQQRIHALLQSQVLSADGALPSVLRQLGYSAADADARARAWPERSTPLAVEQWLASPSSSSLRDLWLGERGGRFASIVSLAGLHDLPALRTAVAAAPGARLVDRVQSVSDVLRAYRQEMSWMLLIIYALAIGFLTLRHGWREALLLVLPSALASAMTLGLFGWFGVPVNLFTLLALWLVLGLGVDYGIFLRHGRSALPTAVLSVTLSACTTLLAFGMLAFSATPFIHSIGLTLLSAICLSWLSALLLCLTLGEAHD